MPASISLSHVSRAIFSRFSMVCSPFTISLTYTPPTRPRPIGSVFIDLYVCVFYVQAGLQYNACMSTVYTSCLLPSLVRSHPRDPRFVYTYTRLVSLSSYLQYHLYSYPTGLYDNNCTVYKEQTFSLRLALPPPSSTPPAPHPRLQYVTRSTECDEKSV